MSCAGGEGLEDIYRTFQLETVLTALLENTFSMTSALEGGLEAMHAGYVLRTRALEAPEVWPDR